MYYYYDIFYYSSSYYYYYYYYTLTHHTPYFQNLREVVAWKLLITTTKRSNLDERTRERVEVSDGY